MGSTTASVQGSLDQVNALAAHTATTAWSFASDFLILLVIFGIVFFLAWRIGRGFFISLTLSLYVGYAIYSLFPYASLLPASSPTVALLSALLVFAAICVLAYLVLRRTISADFVSIGLFGLILLAFLTTGFLMALAYHIFHVQSVYAFTPAIDALFAPDHYFFWWIAAPLLGLFFLAR